MIRGSAYCFVFLFSLCCIGVIHSQVNFGIKAGLSSTELEPKDILFTNGEEFDEAILKIKEVNLGIHIGLVFRIQFNKFFIQPEVLYNSHSVEYQFDEVSNPEFAGLILTERFQNLDIPLMLGLKFSFFRINAGPVGHIELSSASELADLSIDFDQSFDNMTLGYQAGFGFDLWNIHLDFRYEGNFTNYGDHITFRGQSFDFSDTPSRLIGSVGFVF